MKCLPWCAIFLGAVYTFQNKCFNYLIYICLVIVFALSILFFSLIQPSRAGSCSKKCFRWKKKGQNSSRIEFTHIHCRLQKKNHRIMWMGDFSTKWFPVVYNNNATLVLSMRTCIAFCVSVCMWMSAITPENYLD